MDKFVFHIASIISEERLEEVKELRKIIMQDMNIMISMQDTYLLLSVMDEDWTSGKTNYCMGNYIQYIQGMMLEHGCMIKGR